MSRYQKLTLLIGALILVALVAIIAVLLTNSMNNIIRNPPTEGALPMQSDLEVAATQAQLSEQESHALTQTARSMPTTLELTASMVVEMNLTVERQLAGTFAAATRTAAP